MKRSVLAIALASAFAVGSAMAEKANEQTEIVGELVKIEGSTYMIKDVNGMEHALQVDDKTAKEDGIAVGAQVGARVDGTRISSLTLEE